MAQRVHLEQGNKVVFAVSLDWPGWCRAGRNADDALAHLRDYAPRYSSIVTTDLATDDFVVLGSVAGNSTTDFGASRALGPWDDLRASPENHLAHVAVLRKCWRHFDAVVARAPAELVKGPRGGGRDRDQMVDHVREAERVYASRTGLRIAPRTPWPSQRTLLAEHLLSDYEDAKWPPEFAMRVMAWHVVDHAWEIEDKTPYPCAICSGQAGEVCQFFDDAVEELAVTRDRPHVVAEEFETDGPEQIRPRHEGAHEMLWSDVGHRRGESVDL
jgi:hypothetical protein